MNTFAAATTTPNHPVLKQKTTKTMKTAIFFVNAAPYADMINLLREFFNKHGHKMKILFAANLEEFMRDASSDMRAYLPSNCRVYDNGIGFKLNSKKSLMIGPGEAALDFSFQDPPPRSGLKEKIKPKTTDEMFALAQEEVATAVCDMLRFARKNNIPLYFAAQKRDDRALNIKNEQGKVVCKENPKAKCELAFTQWILDKMVIPCYGSNEKVAELLETITPKNASYLADLYPIAMAFINDEHWEGYDMTDINVSKGIYKKNGVLSGDVQGAHYAKINIETDGNQIFSLKKDSQHLVLEKLKELQNGKETRKFENAFVVHDTLLNDIDDAPARHWIQSISSFYEEECNYNREHFQLTRHWPRKDFKPRETIDEFHLAKMRKNLYGDIDEKTQEIVNPRVDPTVFISAYHPFFGINGGKVDKEGYAILLPEEERMNAFTNEQTKSCFTPAGKQMFMICRNAAGNGGTKWAKDGDAGSKWKITKDKTTGKEIKRESNFLKPNGSMSEWHEFVIPTDTSMYWCNAMFFGTGPPGSQYDNMNTLLMLYKLRQIGYEWAKARNIKNPYFGFHEFPQNSLFHLHMHCIDLDQVQDTETGHALPGFKEHMHKTTNLHHYINLLKTRLEEKERQALSSLFIPFF